MPPTVHGEIVPQQRKRKDAAQDDDGVVHVPCGCRGFGWEEEDDGHERHEGDRDDSTWGTQRPEIERTWLEVVLAPEAGNDGDSICNVQTRYRKSESSVDSLVSSKD